MPVTVAVPEKRRLIRLKMMKRLTGCVLLAIITWSVCAQETKQEFKNIEVAHMASTDVRSIPSVVINAKDPRQVLVNSSTGKLYASHDQAVTWESTSTLEHASWISLHTDHKGSIHAVYVLTGSNTRRIAVSQSKDNGKTWSSPVLVSPSGGEQIEPSATFDVKGTLYVVWTELLNDSDGKCKSAILMSTSSNGTKWSKPLRMSLIDGGCESDKSLAMAGVPAVNPDGKMFVSWYNDGKIFLDRSFSSNLWLENDINIQPLTPGWKQQVPGYDYVSAAPMLLMDQSKGTYRGCLYLSWSDQRSGDDDTDVWFTRSNNHGDNWSNPTQLGSAVAKTHQYGVRMAVDQVTGYVYLLYFERADYDNDLSDVMLAYSTESGGSFKTVKLNAQPVATADPAGAGIYLDIAAFNGLIVPVWMQAKGDGFSVMAAPVREDELIKPKEQPKQAKKKKQT